MAQCILANYDAFWETFSRIQNMLLLARSAAIGTLRSLSKDDGYGNENLSLSQVYRNYSVLFALYNTGELSCYWMDTNGFKVKKNDRSIVICSRCRQTVKFGDFTLLFCGVRQRNARKFVLHVQHEYFSFFNQSYSFFVALP